MVRRSRSSHSSLPGDRLSDEDTEFAYMPPYSYDDDPDSGGGGNASLRSSRASSCDSRASSRDSRTSTDSLQGLTSPHSEDSEGSDCSTESKVADRNSRRQVCNCRQQGLWAGTENVVVIVALAAGMLRNG